MRKLIDPHDKEAWAKRPMCPHNLSRNRNDPKELMYKHMECFCICGCEECRVCDPLSLRHERLFTVKMRAAGYGADTQSEARRQRLRIHRQNRIRKHYN